MRSVGYDIKHTASKILLRAAKNDFQILGKNCFQKDAI